MSPDFDTATKAEAAQRLYDALRVGDGESLNALLSADFVGHATDGLPLGMGGEHRDRDAMQRELWWNIGRNFAARAEPERMLAVEDNGLLVCGRYRGTGR